MLKTTDTLYDFLTSPACAKARIHISTSVPRRKPKIGDTRTTKKYGLQIRVVETTSGGSWIRSSSGYYYQWLTPDELRGTQWEYLLNPVTA